MVYVDVLPWNQEKANFKFQPVSEYGSVSGGYGKNVVNLDLSPHQHMLPYASF